MKKHVIWIQDGDQKVYVACRPDGSATAVNSKCVASVFPNKIVANSICRAIRPAIKKNNLNVSMGIEPYE